MTKVYYLFNNQLVIPVYRHAVTMSMIIVSKCECKHNVFDNTAVLKKYTHSSGHVLHDQAQESLVPLLTGPDLKKKKHSNGAQKFCPGFVEVAKTIVNNDSFKILKADLIYMLCTA